LQGQKETRATAGETFELGANKKGLMDPAMPQPRTSIGYMYLRTPPPYRNAQYAEISEIWEICRNLRKSEIEGYQAKHLDKLLTFE
jgi:hypothetical protein